MSTESMLWKACLGLGLCGLAAALNKTFSGMYFWIGIGGSALIAIYLAKGLMMSWRDKYRKKKESDAPAPSTKSRPNAGIVAHGQDVGIENCVIEGYENPLDVKAKKFSLLRTVIRRSDRKK